MKYMQNGGYQHHPLMKLTLNLTLLFLLGLWVTNFCLYFSKMGLTPVSVTEYYLGSEDHFTVPRTYQSMLEVTHMHLPMMAIVILLLTHLIIFAPFSTPAKIGVIVVSFLSAFLSEAAGWLVRFVHPGFAALKIAAFVTFQGMLIFLLYALGHFLWMSKPKPRKPHAKTHP